MCLCIAGHAGYAEKGKDIVCAGVSMTQFILENYVKDCCENVYLSDKEEKNEYLLSFSIDKPESIQAVKAILTGFYALANEYPDYVKICEREITNQVGGK